MNFLAHLYLSGNNAKIMVGNFIGDFVKGRNLLEQFEPEIARGIEIHRAIDAFTDTHPVVRKSKIRLRPTYRHYAPVIVDIFYDHFLARYWDRYNTAPLPEFARHAYGTIEQHHAVLPESVRYMLPYMINGNWLVNYATLEGIQRALSGMARRASHPSRMEEAVNDLRMHYDDFRVEFEEFFPALEKHIRAMLAESPTK
jgi:acyl carrier protein phosphodiesterase